jgi:hypothetical protein
MKNYSVEISTQARRDILDLNDVIINFYKAPLTAKKYIKGLQDQIKKLETDSESYAVQTLKSLTQYGQNVRRLNYKKMAIIYTVH